MSPFLLKYEFVLDFLKNGGIHKFRKNLKFFKNEWIGKRISGFKGVIGEKEFSEIEGLAKANKVGCVFIINSHTNEKTARLIGKEVYKHLKTKGFPIKLVEDKRHPIG